MVFTAEGTQNTGIAASDTFCWVAGFFQDGPVSTGITGTTARTRVGSGGTWLISYAQYDAVDDQGSVYYICVDRSWVGGLENDALCGNAVCDFGEQAAWCPSDCSGTCGDGTCATGESIASCVADSGWTL